MNLYTFLVNASFIISLMIAATQCFGGYDTNKLRDAFKSLEQQLLDGGENSKQLVEFVRKASINHDWFLESKDYDAVFSGVRCYMVNENGPCLDDAPFKSWPFEVSDISIFGKKAYDARVRWLSGVLSNSELLSEKDNSLWFYMSLTQLARQESVAYYDAQTFRLLTSLFDSAEIREHFDTSIFPESSFPEEALRKNLLDVADSIFSQNPYLVWSELKGEYVEVLLRHMSAISDDPSSNSYVPSLTKRYLKKLSSTMEEFSLFSKDAMVMEYGQSLPEWESISSFSQTSFAGEFFSRRGIATKITSKDVPRNLLRSIANLVAYFDYTRESTPSLESINNPRLLFIYLFHNEFFGLN